MQEPCHFYMLPIGGTAMASLAGLLHDSGERVSGVDSILYPPMSELLAELGIPVRLGFDAAAIPPGIDRVVIGNAVPRSNPEVEAVLGRGIPLTSQAAELGERFCRPNRTIVVAGTHGKTTTTALAAHVFMTAGLDPTVMVGGVPRGGRPWRLGHGGWAVVEGDEYNTAFFDKGAKFLHYHPHIFVVNNVEFDHGDIYPNVDAILAAFRAGVARVAPSGRVLANASDPGARAAVAAHRSPVWYGHVGHADLACRAWTVRDGRLHATLHWDGRDLEVSAPLVGRHNLDNLMAAVAAGLLAGIPAELIAQATATFAGVRRRLEIVGEAAGVIVVDDFAHHPTAVEVTLAGARQRFPARRLVALFEPRSLTAGRKMFAPAYLKAFAHADVALIAPLFHRARLGEEESLDREALAAALKRRGLLALALPEGGVVPEAIVPLLRSGDVVLCMSSGDFGGLPRRLLEALGEGV